MQGKTVVITGANAGIGKAAAEALAADGANIVMVCRSQERGEAAMKDIAKKGAGHVELVLADLGDLDDVRRAGDELAAREGPIDVLINNAGLMLSDRRVTKDGNEMTLQVNHLAPFVLTEKLLAKLHEAAGPRIVNVSSAAHRRTVIRWDDLQLESYSGFGAYAQSKLCNVLFTRELAKRLDGKMTVNALHPGVVSTDITNDGDAKGVVKWAWTLMRPFMKSPADGAKTTVHLASSASVANVSGKYFVDSEIASISRAAQSDEDATRLFTVSEEICGTKYDAAIAALD